MSKTNQSQRIEMLAEKALEMAVADGFDPDAVVYDLARPVTVKDLVRYLAVSRAMTENMGFLLASVSTMYRQDAWDDFALGKMAFPSVEPSGE